MEGDGGKVGHRRGATASTGCRCSRSTASPVVLEHHDHTFKRTKPLLGGLANDNGVLYLGDGSWGRLRTPKTPEKRPYLAAASRDYHLSLHRLEGEERFHLALDENGRVMDVCRTGQRLRGVVAVPG